MIYCSPDAMSAAAAEVRTYGETGYSLALEAGSLGQGVFAVRHFDGSTFRLLACKYGNVRRLPADLDTPLEEVGELDARAIAAGRAYLKRHPLTIEPDNYIDRLPSSSVAYHVDRHYPGGWTEFIQPGSAGAWHIEQGSPVREHDENGRPIITLQTEPLRTRSGKSYTVNPYRVEGE